jgi:hypothetical protein
VLRVILRFQYKILQLQQKGLLKMPTISIVLIPATILLLGVVVLSSWLTLRLLSDGVIGVTIQSKVLYILLLIGWWCATLYALHTFAFVFLLFKKIESTPAAAVYNIHHTENSEKFLQKKFAFPSLSSILYYKGLETLARSGCNADIVGVTPVQSYSKSILGLSSGIYASTTSSVFPARQALFVCAWKHRQEENKNCQTRRRTEPCKTKLQSESSMATWSEPNAQQIQLLPKDAAQSRPHQKLNSVLSNGSSKTPLKKFTNTELTAGSKIVFEHLPINTVIYKNSFPCANTNATLTVNKKHLYGATTTGTLFKFGVQKYV